MTFTEYVHAHLNQLCFFANIFLVWIVCNSVHRIHRLPRSRSTDGRKTLHSLLPSLMLAGVTYLASGLSLCTSAYTCIACILFQLAKRGIPKAFLAEIDVIGNLAFSIGLLSLAQWLNLPLDFKAVGVFAPAHVSAIKLIAAIALYSIEGGTNIVQGLLEKGRILPEIGTDSSNNLLKIDPTKYKHGKLIGNAERLILLTLVAIQAYQALAFLITAKGLFRAKDLENRAFSEYFLVGNTRELWRCC